MSSNDYHFITHWQVEGTVAEVSGIIGYDWKIRAAKPLLRRFSWLLKPIFAANHRWAMARGEESLRLELARRHAATPEERRRIPAPPDPSTVPSPLIALGVAAAGGVGVLVARRRK